MTNPTDGNWDGSDEDDEYERLRDERLFAEHGWTEGVQEQ